MKQLSNCEVGDIIFNGKENAVITKIATTTYQPEINNVLYFTMESGKTNYKYLRQLNDEKWVVKRKTKKLKDMFDTWLKLDKVRLLPRPGTKHGSDPEIFVTDKTTGEVIPAFEFLGSKENPTQISNHPGVGQGSGLPLFWDGFQAEFNTKADTCFAWVADSIYNGLRTLDKLAKNHNPNAVIAIKNTHDIALDRIIEGKEEHVEFGCMPSFNAYGHKGIKADGREVFFRSAGGHIHFGNADRINGNHEIAKRYVKTLDKILGVACVSLFANIDDPRRRSMYGLAGEYRLPKHGLEYRTLSNAWMCHPLIFNMVFELARKVESLVDKKHEDVWDCTEQEAIDCINNCDVELARKILKRNKEVFCAFFTMVYDSKEKKSIYKIFMSGVESIIENPDDVINNWKKGYISHCEGHGHTVSRITQSPLYHKVASLDIE